MKKEDSSSGALDTSASKMQLQKNQSLSSTFDPFEEIGITLNKGDPADRQQLQKLIGGYLCYPSSQLAEIHAEAMRLGNYDIEGKIKIDEKGEKGEEVDHLIEDEGRKMCPCCGFVRQTDTIKFCTPFNDIKNIGMSTSLYFYTFKNLAIMLAIMCIVYSLFAIITNAVAAGTSVSTLYSLDYIAISLAAKQKNDTSKNRTYYIAQCSLGALMVVIWAAVLIGVKYNELKNSIEYDNDTTSCADYTIVMEGLPLDITKEELQPQLETYYNVVVESKKIPESRKSPFRLATINVGRPFYLNEQQLNTDDLKEVNKEISEIKETFVEWVMERTSRSTFSEPKTKREETYKKYEELMTKKMKIMQEQLATIKKQLKEEKGDQLTTVFLTFQTNTARNLLAALNQVTILSRLTSVFGDKDRFVFRRGDKEYKPSIAGAPEPEDIVWTNVGLGDCSIYCRKIFTYTFTLVLLGASFAIVYGLSVKQNELTAAAADPNDAASRYLSIAISLVLAGVNVILTQTIKFLTRFQKDYTSTNYHASLAVKSIMAQMINSVLIPVIVAYYIKKNVYESSGLVDNTFMMSFSLSLVGPVMVFFDPSNYLAMLTRCWKRRVRSKLYQSQREHNSYHEGLQFQVGYEYIYLVNLFIFACFFVSLQPIISFVALVGYLLMYWVQKYCMFYRYRRPVPGSEFINQAVYQFVHFGPFIYSIGSLTWSNFMPGGIPQEAVIPNLVAVGISVLIFLVPMKPFIIRCFFEQEVEKTTKYSEDRITFSTEYDRLNPTTQEEATKQFNEYCEKYIKNLSAERQKEILLKKKKNNQKGQLANLGQQSSQPLAFAGLGTQGTANLFAGMIQPQPAAVNPYSVFNAFHHPQQSHMAQMPPARAQQVQPGSSGLMGMMMQPQPQHAPMQQIGGMHGMPGMQPNPFASLFAPQPQPMMGGFYNPMGMMASPYASPYPMW